MTDFKANAPNSISAGAQPQTPLGELTALPRPPSWIWGPLRVRGGAGLGKRRERGGGGEGGGSGWEGKGGPQVTAEPAPQSLATPLDGRLVVC